MKYIVASLVALLLLTGCQERHAITLSCEKGDVYYNWYRYVVIGEHEYQEGHTQGFYLHADGTRMQCVKPYPSKFATEE